jgi:transposase
MTPGVFLSRFIALPELEIKYVKSDHQGWMYMEATSTSVERHCPKCATVCSSVYDHRHVRVLDAPVRDHKVSLRIRKKRYRTTSKNNSLGVQELPKPSAGVSSPRLFTDNGSAKPLRAPGGRC